MSCFGPSAIVFTFCGEGAGIFSNHVHSKRTPLYLKDFMITRKEQAWNNALLLAENVDTLVVDHHLFRSEEGSLWVEELRQKTGRNILSAAEIHDMPLQLLEAGRVSMYSDIPVPPEWHERFFLNREAVLPFLEQARDLYPWFAY